MEKSTRNSEKIPAARLGLKRQRNGVAMLAVTVAVILLAIGLSVAIPRVDHELRREKEDHLRFVLGEFRRAVEKFKRCHNQLPENIDQLIKDDAGNRFLRRKYDDPFTSKFDWQVEISSGAFVVHSISEEKGLGGAPYSAFR